MKKVTISALSALLLVGQMSANAATTLFDNLGSAWLGDFNPGTDTTRRVAQSFNSGAVADTLTSVTLNLHQAGSGSGTFFVSLYSKPASGVTGPGSFIASIVGPSMAIGSLGTAQGSTWVSSALTIAMTPNTDYFIVAGEQSAGSGLLWGISSVTYPDYTSVYSQTFNSGVAWSSFGDQPLRMQVQGDLSVVPEPAGYMAASLLALFGIGHFARGYLRRKTDAKA